MGELASSFGGAGFNEIEVTRILMRDIARSLKRKLSASIAAEGERRSRFASPSLRDRSPFRCCDIYRDMSARVSSVEISRLRAGGVE